MSFRKMVNIIVGTLNNVFHYNKEVSNSRLIICKDCPYHKVLWKFGSICKQCGCVLESKTTVTYEKCPMNKW